MERKPYPSFEGDSRQDDNRRRLFGRINPVTKEALSGLFGSSETPSKAPTERPESMPVSVIVPEGEKDTSPAGASLGGEARPPEESTKTSEESKNAAFRQLLEEAGLEELSDSFKQKGETESRNQARARRLISYGAGLLVGSHLGVERVKPESARVVREIKEREAIENPFEAKDEEHVVQDAWKRIVVDKYGREVIDARQQYGKAFQQEQKEIIQSALSDDTPKDSGQDQMTVDDVQAQPRPEPTAPTTVVHVRSTPIVPLAPMLSGPVPTLTLPTATPQEPALPAGITQPMLQTGKPTREDPQHLLPAHFKTGLSLALNPWVWFVVGLLLLVFFAVSLFG